jgi:hypothetical protein
MRKSFENRLIVHELSKFLLTVAKFAEGVVAPTEVIVVFVIFGQELGVTTQAGMVSSVVSVMK